MSGDCRDDDTAVRLASQERRRTLYAVLAINVLMFAGEFGAGVPRTPRR